MVAPFGYSDHAKVMDILTNADPTIRVGPAYSTILNCINSVKGNRWPRCRPGSVPVEGRPVPSPESAAYQHPLRGFAAAAAAPGVRHRHRRRHRTAPPLPPRSAAAAPIRRRRPAPPPPSRFNSAAAAVWISSRFQNPRQGPTGSRRLNCQRYTNQRRLPLQLDRNPSSRLLLFDTFYSRS